MSLLEGDGNIVEAMNYAVLACLLRYKKKKVVIEENIPLISEDKEKGFSLNHLPIVMAYGIFNEKSKTDETNFQDLIIRDPTVVL